MNDGNWRSNEPNYFNKLLDTWKSDLPKSKVFHEYQQLSQKMTFDVNTPQIISSSFNR